MAKVEDMTVAAEWFERLQNEDLSADEVLRWQQWLAEDESHREAFRRCEDLWKRLDEVPVPRLPSRAEMKLEHAVGPRMWRYALAASIVVVAVLAGWLWIVRGKASGPMTALETGAAEHQELRLPDGSQLSLGGKSLLLIHFAATERRVALERGEAFFEVAKDRRRPFVVRAGDATITAIGTAFNVRRTGDRVLVVVSEGAVRVKDSQSGVERQVDAGQEAAVERSSAAPVLQVANAERATGWREGRLQYLGEPLKYVLADVSRYSKEEITLGDAEVGQLRVTGTVYESDVAAWLGSLEEILPVTVEKRGDGRVVRMRAAE